MKALPISILRVLENLAAPYTVHITRSELYFGTRVELRSKRKVVYTTIDEEKLVTSNFQDKMFVDVVKHLKKELDELEAGVSNDYPDVRVWARAHLISNATLDGKPIPGWIWPRWNAAHPGMKALKTGGIEPVGKGSSVVRKVVVKRGTAVRDPSKIKKPFCPVHTTEEMIFNPIRSVWMCDEIGCNLVAHPKNEPEQGRVTLGKGNVSLRLICGPENTKSVVLISDDNIALDITQMVSIEEIEASFEIRRAVEAAKNTGLDTISVPIRKEIIVKTTASITGANHYSDQF